MSPIDNPERLSTLWVAGIGAVSMKIGSSPARENAWKRARGVRPSLAAMVSLMINAPEAPSVNGEELPGVMCQLISGKRSAYSGL